MLGKEGEGGSVHPFRLAKSILLRPEPVFLEKFLYLKFHHRKKPNGYLYINILISGSIASDSEGKSFLLARKYSSDQGAAIKRKHQFAYNKGLRIKDLILSVTYRET